MPSDLSPAQLTELRSELRASFARAQEELRQKLLQSDDERYIELAGSVHDLEDQSVADLLADVNLAVIDFNLEEVRELESALLRIARGTYGVCEECGAGIDYQRLRAHPTALRCHLCQVRHEQTHAGKGQPSL
jgi:RNA polymerase-binding transcription factor DksA